MSTRTPVIEHAYQDLVESMTPAERVARSASMFEWTREQLARQIVAERGSLDPELIKWNVALRLYRGDRTIGDLIERKLADVSR